MSTLEHSRACLKATFKFKVFPGLSTVCDCVQAHEATNLMRQSIREEHALKLDFLSTVLKHVSSLAPLTGRTRFEELLCKALVSSSAQIKALEDCAACNEPCWTGLTVVVCK